MYWAREIVGWLLVAAGLALFYVVYLLCLDRGAAGGEAYTPILEAVVLGVVGIVVFRGGVHLLKVSVAARICAGADERLYPNLPESRGRGEPRASARG